MKVTCQSCQAKYTIADEKVRGKVAKIRCKKCGTTIIVDGAAEGTPSVSAEQPGTAPVADYTQQGGDGEQWTVLVADGDQRTLSAAQIAELHASATISYETLVWKDGMGDWLPISDIDALRSVLENGPRPTMTPIESTNGHSVRPSAPPPPRSEPAGAFARAKTPEPVAARRPGRGGSTDLFGTPAHDDVLTSASESQSPPRGDDKPTGSRNENSVLFSLSALTGGGAAAASASSMPERDPTSNKADLRALMGSGGGPPAPGKSKIDDIMNLSGGGVYSPGLLASPALAPPPIDFASTAQASDSGGSKSKSLMMAIVGGVVVVGAVALAFTTMSSKSDSAEKTSGAANAVLGTNPRTGNTPAAGNEAPADLPAAVANAAPRTGEAVRQGESAGEPTAAAPGAAPIAVAPGAVAPGAVAPAAPKGESAEPKRPVATGPRPEKPAGASPSPAVPPPPVAPPPVAAPAAAPAAAGGTGDFDRAAALSALSAAATAAQSCKKPDGPTGSGRITVTFANNGMATTANVEGPPFAGTPVGGCVAARFRSAHVPPFAGSSMTVHKTFIIN